MKAQDLERIVIENSKDIAGLVEITKNLSKAVESNAKYHNDSLDAMHEKMDSLSKDLQELKKNIAEKKLQEEEARDKKYEAKYAAKWVETAARVVIGAVGVIIVGQIINLVLKIPQ